MADISNFENIVHSLKAFDEISVSIGNYNISIWMLLQAAFVFSFLYFLLKIILCSLEKNVKASKFLNCTQKILFLKTARIILFIIFIFLGFHILGIDVAGLAIFSGALGLGIGIGLQRLASQFLSGYMLLLDKSIKPGDIIAIKETYGVVDKMEARYVSIITHEGKKLLIPNETLANEIVENWSHCDQKIQITLTVGISYESDVIQAQKIMLNAAHKHKRILTDPAPQCGLIEFADSAINLKLYAWINDPMTQIEILISELNFFILKSFNQEGIEFPYPQQNIMLKSSPDFFKEAKESLQQ